MRLLLVRHGQNEDNAAGILNGHRDKGLTDLGREQAERAAEQLVEWEEKNGEVDWIISSPLKRAFETAEIIAGKIGGEVKTDDQLIERDFGVFTGRPRAEIKNFGVEVVDVEGHLYFLDGDGVETFAQLYERAADFLERLKNVAGDKTVVVVAHGDLGKMLRAVVEEWTWMEGLTAEYIPNAELIELI